MAIIARAGCSWVDVVVWAFRLRESVFTIKSKWVLAELQEVFWHSRKCSSSDPRGVMSRTSLLYSIYGNGGLSGSEKAPTSPIELCLCLHFSVCSFLNRESWHLDGIFWWRHPVADLAVRRIKDKGDVSKGALTHTRTQTVLAMIVVNNWLESDRLGWAFTPH